MKSLCILAVLFSSQAFATEETRAAPSNGPESEVSVIETRTVQQSSVETRQVQQPIAADNHHDTDSNLGDWQLVSDHDIVSIKLDAYSTQDSHTALTIRCSSNVTEVYIGWDEQFDSGKVNVTSSVVGHHGKTVAWDVSASGKSTFYPQRGTIRFIKHLVKYDKVSTTASTHDGDVLAAVFYTEGLKKAIKPIRTACHW